LTAVVLGGIFRKNKHICNLSNIILAAEKAPLASDRQPISEI
jgi:hypothetical protein